MLSIVTRSLALLSGSAPRLASATNWDLYYERPYKSASLTRKITGADLVRQIKKFGPRRPVIAELGGANSCFFDLILSSISPSQYHIVDNNQFGLDQFRRRIGNRNLKNVFTYNQDVLNLDLSTRVDLAFSVGLVEHFDVQRTKQAIAAHFKILKPGGIAVLAFPTPTFLYVLARRLAETAGMWMFPDERPLALEEVAAAAQKYGRLLYKKIIWPIVFTQYLTVWQKYG